MLTSFIIRDVEPLKCRCMARRKTNHHLVGGRYILFTGIGSRKSEIDPENLKSILQYLKGQILNTVNGDRKVLSCLFFFSGIYLLTMSVDDIAAAKN